MSSDKMSNGRVCANYYEVLGVTASCSSDDIKRAYYKKALQLHPDKNPDDPEATHKFQELSKAYDTISNPEKRGRYDRRGFVDDSDDEDGEYEFEDAQNLFDVIAEMFMQRGGFGGVGCGMFHYSSPQMPAHMPGSMPPGPFGCTCGAYMHEDEYYDSSDGEPGEASHRYVRENYHAHEEAARRSEQRSRQIFEERRANAAISKLARPKMQSRTDCSLTIGWTAPGRVDVSHYELEVMCNDGAWEACSSGNFTSAVVDGLKPSTQYHFRVRGCKDDRVGEWSASSSYRTSSAVRAEKKEEVKAEPAKPAKPVAKPKEDEKKKNKKEREKAAKERKRKEEEIRKAEEVRKKAAEEERKKEETKRKAEAREREEAEKKVREEEKKAKREAKKAARQARKAQEQLERGNEPTPAAKEPPAPAEAAVDTEPTYSTSTEEQIFQLCLQLEDMGFTDRARNEHFLQNNRCDLAATIDALIASTVSDSSPTKSSKEEWTTMTRKEKKATEEVHIPAPAQTHRPEVTFAQLPKPSNKGPDARSASQSKSSHNWSAAVPKPSGGDRNAWGGTQLPAPNPPTNQDRSFPPLAKTAQPQPTQHRAQQKQQPASYVQPGPARAQPAPSRNNSVQPAPKRDQPQQGWQSSLSEDSSQPGPAVEASPGPAILTDESLVSQMLSFMGSNQARHQPFVQELEEMVFKMFPQRSAANCYPKYGSLKACLQACVNSGLIELGGTPPMDWVRLRQQQKPAAVAPQSVGHPSGLESTHAPVANGRHVQAGLSNGIGQPPGMGHKGLQAQSELDPNASTFDFTSGRANHMDNGRGKRLSGNAWMPHVETNGWAETAAETTVGGSAGTWSKGAQSGQQFGLGGLPHSDPRQHVQSQHMFSQQPPQQQPPISSEEPSRPTWAPAPGPSTAAPAPFHATPGLYQNVAPQNVAPQHVAPGPAAPYGPQPGAGLWGSAALGGSLNAPLNAGWGNGQPLGGHSGMFGDSMWGGFGPSSGLGHPGATSSQENPGIWNGTEPDTGVRDSAPEDSSWTMPQVEMDLTEIMEGPDSPDRGGQPEAQHVTAPW